MAEKEYIERDELLQLYDPKGIPDAEHLSVPFLVVRQNILDAPATDVRPVEWISVKDRLPDMADSDWVLGVVSGRAGYTMYDNAVVCVGYDPDNSFFLEEYPDAEITVTHWMPLPEPPEVSK